VACSCSSLALDALPVLLAPPPHRRRRRARWATTACGRTTCLSTGCTPRGERSRTGWRRLCRHPRPQTWQARAWRGLRPMAPPSLAKTRLGREFGRAVRTAVRTTATIIVWARETGRAAPLRRDRREGLQAVGRTGEGTRADGRVWEVGTDTARAQARASRPLRRRRRRKRERQRGLACGRECGPQNAGHMRATQWGPGRVQTCEQTGRWERTGQVKWTTAPHGHSQGTHDTDTVKAWTRLQRVMPSASLV
jgi:hypothetical protein